MSESNAGGDRSAAGESRRCIPADQLVNSSETCLARSPGSFYGSALAQHRVQHQALHRPSPDGKLTGDLGNAIESTEIDGRRSRRPLAGKLSPGDFRLLQQYRPQADIICLKDHRVSLDPLSRIYGSVPVASACFIGVIGARRPHPITIPWRTRRRALLCVSA